MKKIPTFEGLQNMIVKSEETRFLVVDPRKEQKHVDAQVMDDVANTIEEGQDFTIHEHHYIAYVVEQPRSTVYEVLNKQLHYYKL